MASAPTRTHPIAMVCSRQRVFAANRQPDEDDRLPTQSRRGVWFVSFRSAPPNLLFDDDGVWLGMNGIVVGARRMERASLYLQRTQQPLVGVSL